MKKRYLQLSKITEKNMLNFKNNNINYSRFQSKNSIPSMKKKSRTCNKKGFLPEDCIQLRKVKNTQQERVLTSISANTLRAVHISTKQFKDERSTITSTDLTKEKHSTHRKKKIKKTQQDRVLTRISSNTSSALQFSTTQPRTTPTGIQLTEKSRTHNKRGL